jgi:hypothetical protein
MPKIVITHGVTDVDQWSKFASERADAIGGMGGSNVTDHVAEDGSNAVAVTVDVDHVDVILAAIASPSPELADAMARHGVLPPLSVYVST